MKYSVDFVRNMNFQFVWKKKHFLNFLVHYVKKYNRSHSLATDRLLQGFSRGQLAPKCVFLTDYALKPEKRLLAVRGKVNNYEKITRLLNHSTI